MPSKIVVIGDVDGKLQEVFTRLAALHAKQNFAFAIIAGNLFSDPKIATQTEDEAVAKLIKGDIVVPLTTYFSLGTQGLPPRVIEKLEKDDGELCPNLFILGRRVSVRTAEGFRVVALGGKHKQPADAPINAFDATHSDTDVAALAKEQSNVDLLITNDWPAAISDGSRVVYEDSDGVPPGAQTVSDLCAALKPRYHFSASQGYYEREPFFHPGEAPRPITRFISLAPFGNANKQKWISAFSLEPSADPPSALPEGCTASPFTSKKRKLDSQQESFNSFRYANGDTRTDHYEPDRRRRKFHHRSQPPPTPDQCFFCLSNEAFESHMVGAIGEDTYIAVAKGPLTTRETYPELGIPGHILIIPVQHSPTISLIPEKDVQKSTVAEMQRYRSAMHDLLVSRSKDESTGRAKLGAVTWEISRAGGVHLHWQFLPVPADMVNRGLVEAAFDVEAENMEFPKFAKTTSAMVDVEEGDYIKVMIWSEAVRKDMVLPIDGSYRFDLQFGRKVLAKLLGLMDRMDWKACVQAKDEESADAEKFKEIFKSFDFSLEGE